LGLGTFAEMSSNVKGFVETAAEYGVEHVGVSMAAMTSYVARIALRRMYKA
jgi:hypothetical protein